MNVIGTNTKKRNRFLSLPPNIFSLRWVSFFTDVSCEMIYPLLPNFTILVLEVGTTFLGFVEGAAETAASILTLFWGWFSDRVKKRKPLILTGYSFSTAAHPYDTKRAKPWEKCTYAGSPQRFTLYDLLQNDFHS